MQKARRKLIKGALAAAVVTTAGCGGGGGSGGGGGALGTGASTFSVPTDTRSVSSWHLCIERSAREAEASQLQPVTALDDTFLRTEVQVADGLLVDGGKFVPGPFVNVGGTYYPVVQTLDAPSSPTQWTTMNAQPRNLTPGYAAVKINDFGEPTTLALVGTDGSVATDSCWSSVVTRVAAKYG